MKQITYKLKTSKTLHFIFFVTFILMYYTSLFAKTTTVSSASEFTTAVQNADPGDFIIIKNGTYTDFKNLTVDCEGTSERPITIEAESKHGAILKGSGHFKVTGKHITFKDLRSENGGRRFAISGSYIRITGCYFFNHGDNLITIGSNGTQDFPKHNRIDHNEFYHNYGKILIVYQWGSMWPQHIIMEYNTIIDQYYNGVNTDTLQLGDGTPSVTGRKLFAKVRYNYFERINNCNEAISIKSSANEVTGNIILDSKAGIWIRKGEDNIVEDNWIENSDEGIMVLGKNHRVMNNVVINSKYGIQLPYGIGYDTTEWRIPPANDCIIANNTLYNNRLYGIHMSLWKGRVWTQWPTGGGTSDNPPIDNLIINNIIQGNQGTLFDNDEATSQNDISHQLFYKTGGSYGYSGADVIKANPDFNNPPIDFHLELLSPAQNSSRIVNPDVTSDNRGAIGDYPSAGVNGGPVNKVPIVSAGPDQTISLPAEAVLNGTVTDDGKPDPPASVTTTWTKHSGPGTVTLDNVKTVESSASFSSAGTYVLRLTADDSDLQASDDVTVTVKEQAPKPTAGSPSKPTGFVILE